MPRQRNNISRLPYEQRHEISKMLFEGATYSEIRQAMTQARCTEKIHNTSLLAWSKGKEYQEYCDVRKGFDAQSKGARLAAMVMNDGAGPQSLADIAEYELLQNIVLLAQDDEMGPKTAAALAKAIADLKKTQIAGALEKQLTKCKRLEDQLREQKAEYEEKLQKVRDKLAELQAGGKDVDPVKVADQMNKLLGMKAVDAEDMQHE